jgi:hypothetical protein
MTWLLNFDPVSGCISLTQASCIAKPSFRPSLPSIWLVVWIARIHSYLTQAPFSQVVPNAVELYMSEGLSSQGIESDGEEYELVGGSEGEREGLPPSAQKRLRSGNAGQLLCASFLYHHNGCRDRSLKSSISRLLSPVGISKGPMPSYVRSVEIRFSYFESLFRRSLIF